MKKLIAFALPGLATCLSSFAQANFTFNSGTMSRVWDDFASPGTFVKAGAGELEVAVMWTTDLSAIPTTGLNGAATPTNEVFLASWTGILTDPNFHLAQSTAAGNPIIVTQCGYPGPFAGVYGGGLQYIVGTSPGETVQLYVIGWDRSFGTDPLVAALNFASVGWSSAIHYTLGSTVAPGVPLSVAGIGGFGVHLTPEPSTFALAGLGAAAVLILRRRRDH